MEQSGLAFTRIRCPRIPDPRAFTAQTHRASHLTTFAEPAYPITAKENRIEGKVILDAVIGTDGTVKELSIREGHPLLAEAAAQTVRQWRYRPTTVNGRPVEVQTDIEVTFALPDSVLSI
jgi:TonB family protein